MTPSDLRAAETEWWFPKVIDTAYCDRLRRDYPEDAELDDDSLREKYGCTGKYNKPSLWDHTGDAEEDYERLADEYLKLRDHILATVRADDGEPVTEERVLALGWTDRFGSGTLWSPKSNRAGPVVRVMWDRGLGCDGWKLDGNSLLPNMETMGQLRNLLSALGIEAKEQA